MTQKAEQVRAALKAHVKAQAKLDAEQIKLVQRAHSAGVPLQEVADALNISLRTTYNRLEGKGPRVGSKWRD